VSIPGTMTISSSWTALLPASLSALSTAQRCGAIPCITAGTYIVDWGATTMNGLGSRVRLT
jgi:hypothetical protein